MKFRYFKASLGDITVRFPKSIFSPIKFLEKEER